VSKQWNEMNEVAEASAATKARTESGTEDSDEKEKQVLKGHKRSLRERLRTRILRKDPRSKSEGVDRTPIAVDGSGERDSDPDTSLTCTPTTQPATTLLEDPRSPAVGGQVGGGVERTPLVVKSSGDQDTRTPVRGGTAPPTFELPPPTPCTSEDPESPPQLTRPCPIVSTPATIPLVPTKEQPSLTLTSRLRETVLLTAMREQQVSSTPPAAGEVEILFDSPGSQDVGAERGHNDSPGPQVVGAEGGHNDSSLLI